MVRRRVGRCRLQPGRDSVVINRIGGAAGAPKPADPGAGEGDSYGAAVQAVARALGVPTEKVGALKEGLRAAVFALYREYEGEAAPVGPAAPDPGI